MKYSMTSSMSIVSMKKSESESTSRIMNDITTTTTSSAILDDNDDLNHIKIVLPSNTSGRIGERDPDVIIGQREEI